MATDHLGKDPVELTDQELLEVCLETPSASAVGLRYHLELKRRENRENKLLLWLAFWAACAATASLMLTIALLLSKVV